MFGAGATNDHGILVNNQQIPSKLTGKAIISCAQPTPTNNTRIQSPAHSLNVTLRQIYYSKFAKDHTIFVG